MSSTTHSFEVSTEPPVLNRRVTVIGAQVHGAKEVRYVSDLVNYPFVVLLGEPGSGKTSTLKAEAAKEGTVVFTARELTYKTDPRNPHFEDRLETLYVDAIDEYRSEGSATDKAWNLTTAMSVAKPTRWRIACRSEDWRSDADIKPFLQLTNGERPIVVQLQPLQDTEVLAILRHLEEEAPEQFLETAYSFGAHGLLQTPLSVKLMHRAVKQNGAVWPEGRFALFASATKALGEEDNDDYEGKPRHSAEQRLALAGRISLIMLLSGAEYIWRSNSSKAKASIEPRRLVDADDLGIDPGELSDVLDSSLFKGEGKQFEPMHRTIAEFLAARTLALTVAGKNTLAALPLSRAIALVSGFDGSPPTELRGLYAWFAAHLSACGDIDGAGRLVKADAVSVLAYGDASVFPVDLRRTILLSLTKEDPYFRASGGWLGTEVVAFGGLASEELAGDFARVLEGQDNEGHLLVTIFEVLSTGKPVASIRPLLRNIALDSQRPDWHRVRAVRAWLNSPDIRNEREGLLDALAIEAPSIAREKVRAELILAHAAGPLEQSIVKSILSSFEECPEDNTIGHLTNLRLRMCAEPPVGFFDEPVSSWRSKSQRRPRAWEVDELLDQLLAAMIRKTPNLSGENVWEWARNLNVSIWTAMKKESSEALAVWMSENEEREIALFDAILSSSEQSDAPWLPGNIYTQLARRQPSPPMIQSLLQKASQEATSGARQHLLSIAVEIVRAHTLGKADACFWAVHEALLNDHKFPDLLTRLIQDDWPNELRGLSAHRIDRSSDDAQTAASNVEELTPLLAEIAAGQHPNVLRWAAELYFAPKSHDDLPCGLNRVIYYSDAPVAAAVSAGFHAAATSRLGGLTVTDIGKLAAQNQHYAVEIGAVAGVDIMLEASESSALSFIDIEIAISALRLSYYVQPRERRERLEKWASLQICKIPTAGIRSLTEFWRAALAAGATELSLISQLLTDTSGASHVVGSAIETLLVENKDIPADVLKQLMHAASRLLAPRRILEIAGSNFIDESVPELNRVIWKYALFYLNPQQYGEQFLRDNEGKGLVDLLDSFSGNDLAGLLATSETSARIVRSDIAVRLFGILVLPSDGLETSSAQGRARQIVQTSLQWLSANDAQEAGDVLQRLLKESSLASWKGFIQHAAAIFNRRRRDSSFSHPVPESIRSALEGGPPANGADLFSVVVEELRRLANELRSDDVTPWKRYWNVDSKGKPTGPLIENECRDRLLERLRDRLKPYKIAPPMPEARRSEETRADIISLTAIGHTVPIEAKRNNHSEVWTAAATQLQGYANSAGADGHVLTAV
ncbi:NACHT domain-containing NTPase [Paraburkholderia sp. EG286B]|uniref:NACHT domain-containing NTPase n=1 Tax=Paraburkholderia sp. EG286B TaxID=3237011 RepID=UPI0034D3524A